MNITKSKQMSPNFRIITTDMQKSTLHKKQNVTERKMYRNKLPANLYIKKDRLTNGKFKKMK